MRCFGRSLRAYNSSLEYPFFKLKAAFCSSKEGLSNDVFRSGICDWSKSSIFDKTKGLCLAVLSKMRCFGRSLRAHNSSLECPFFKLKAAFCSSEKGLSNDVFRSGIYDRSKSSIFDKTKGISLAVFSKNEVFWQIFEGP